MRVVRSPRPTTSRFGRRSRAFPVMWLQACTAAAGNWQPVWSRWLHVLLAFAAGHRDGQHRPAGAPTAQPGPPQLWHAEEQHHWLVLPPIRPATHRSLHLSLGAGAASPAAAPMAAPAPATSAKMRVMLGALAGSIASVGVRRRKQKALAIHSKAFHSARNCVRRPVFAMLFRRVGFALGRSRAGAAPRSLAPRIATRAMHLSPRELDHLRLSQAGNLAQRRLARGCQLNHPEAMALISSQMMEMIRDGKSVADLMTIGQQLLGRRQVLPGIASLIAEVQIEATFEDGTKLLTIHSPISARDGDLSLALYGSFLPVPDLSVFGELKEEEAPGATLYAAGEGITLNAGRNLIEIAVINSGDRPIQARAPFLCRLQCINLAPNGGGVLGGFEGVRLVWFWLVDWVAGWVALSLHRDQRRAGVRPRRLVRHAAERAGRLEHPLRAGRVENHHASRRRRQKGGVCNHYSRSAPA